MKSLRQVWAAAQRFLKPAYPSKQTDIAGVSFAISLDLRHNGVNFDFALETEH